MSKNFLMKDIALQAGVSLATVDRVLHKRSGIRPQTCRRVQQAIQELERQTSQVGLTGRKFLIDLVMQAPLRFTEMVRNALEREMPSLQPAVFRARYHLNEVLTINELVSTLDKIASRGSHGVLLKAPDAPEVVEAVRRLHERGIPVITLVTDLPQSQRLTYVGMNNREAGETAAYLMGQWLKLKAQRSEILVSLSSNRFRGEEEREMGFRQAMRRHYPGLHIHDISEGHGIHDATAALVKKRLAELPHVTAVYSIGGANAAILQAFKQLKRTCHVFMGHDLDADNLQLLAAGQIHALLHHDLRHDMRNACLWVMQSNRMPLKTPPITLSPVQIVTPFNVPQH